jgi:hypothetical protein
VPVSLASVSALLATDWVEWTAIATFIAAGAAIALGIVTLLLVLVTREMVTNASDEIAIERRRIDEAIRPRVFPAPGGGWGDDSGYSEDVGGSGWRAVLPVTNGGPGVALNIGAELRWGAGSQLVAQTIPTSLGPGESRELDVNWQSKQSRWGQLLGLLLYSDISGALWRTRFRIYEEGRSA